MNDYPNAFDELLDSLSAAENLNNARLADPPVAPSSQPLDLEVLNEFCLENGPWSARASAIKSPPSNGFTYFSEKQNERVHPYVRGWLTQKLRRVSYSAEVSQQHTASNPVLDCPPLDPLPYPITHSEPNLTSQTAQTSENNTFDQFLQLQDNANAQYADIVEYDTPQYRYAPYPQRATHYSTCELSYSAFSSVSAPVPLRQPDDTYFNHTALPHSSAPGWDPQYDATFFLLPFPPPQDHMSVNEYAEMVTTNAKGKARAEPPSSPAPSLPLPTPTPPCIANKPSKAGPIRSKRQKCTNTSITLDSFTPVILDIQADPRGLTAICQWLNAEDRICGEHYHLDFVCDHVRNNHLKPTVPESQWSPEFTFRCRWKGCKHAGSELKLCSLKNHFQKHRPPKFCQWCRRVFDRQYLLNQHVEECEGNPENMASGSK
ncbi:hypothetical protein VNI00_014764 [Paramarasmius palmivorus]|uniref:C2H2-type domain-containing protein n=1 Tax=Paramarasmius palmivorus TaxID=297713 RepID=A0AAW0BQF3_9AGAR